MFLFKRTYSSGIIVSACFLVKQEFLHKYSYLRNKKKINSEWHCVQHFCWQTIMAFLLQLNSMLNKPVSLKQRDFYLIRYFHQREMSTLDTSYKSAYTDSSTQSCIKCGTWHKVCFRNALQICKSWAVNLQPF